MGGEQPARPREMVPGAGHYPHAEMPDVAGPIILSFRTNAE